MPLRSRSRNPATLSYHALRRAVGIIAMSLPFALASGAILLALIGPDHALPQPILQRSISDYYYTPVGNYLVGSLAVIAAFVFCSRGYDLSDEITGYLAGASTLGVAILPPVNPRGGYTQLQVDIGFAHTGFAALMFLALAYFCLFLFRRTSPEKRLTRRKRHRNNLYAICGFTIVISMMGMVSLTLQPVTRVLQPIHPILCFESLALMAFGVAWLTKGEGFLKDRPHIHTEAS
jgi:hypothetical protein